MTDQLDDLFRDLRADTLTAVRPPGAPAARRTLRRRRTTRAAGAAACLAVAGIGGVGAHLMGPTSPEVGDRPARAAAAVAAGDGARFRGQGAAVSAMVAGGVVLQGHYALALSCVGKGRVTLRILVGGGEMGRASARCDETGQVTRTVLTLPDTLTTTAEAIAEDGAAGRAGYAYAMTLLKADRDRLMADAVTRLPTARGPVVTRWGGLVDGGMQDTATLDPGRYRIIYACVGTGQLSMTLRTAATMAAAAYPCVQYPGHQEATVDVRDRGEFAISIAPDAEADLQAAYAVRLERL